VHERDLLLLLSGSLLAKHLLLLRNVFLPLA
jgi:hypothetical protein